MTPNEYQSAVKRTMTLHSSFDSALSNYSMGLAGESGELIDILKKHLYHGHELDKIKAFKELGDVCWYIAALAQVLGLTLEDIMGANIIKLQQRFPNGFNSADSIARKDVQNNP